MPPMPSASVTASFTRSVKSLSQRSNLVMPTPITHTLRLAMTEEPTGGARARQDLRAHQRDAGLEGAAPLRVPLHRRYRPRRLGRPVVLPERALPPADVVPAPVLVADGAQHPGRCEAHPLVEPHARRVGERDDADSAAEPLQREATEQRGVQAEADTIAVMIGTHVRRDLDGPLIRAARVEAPAVGVAEHAAARLAEKPEPDLERRPDALPELLLAGRLGLEGDGRMAHEGRVDREHRGRVLLAGETDDRHRRRHTQADPSTL